MKKDNRGFSLVELLVAMAVVALIGTMVLSFLMISTRTYGKVTKEADMQGDAQIVLAQLYNYVVDADGALRYFVDTAESGTGTEVLSDDQYAGGAVDFASKRLEIYKNAEAGMTLETISWKKSAESLTYKREKIDGAGNKISDVLEQVLATNVTFFSADLTDAESKDQVKMAVSLLVTGKEYQAQNTVNLRNKIVINVLPADTILPALVSTVTSVKVVPQNIEVEKNNRKTFQAVVNGTNNPSQEVTWTVEGATSPLTVIDSAGRLWVSSDERATEISARATSVQDNTKSGVGAVTVKKPERGHDKLTLGTVRDYYTYTGMSFFLYARVNGELTGDVTWSMECLDGSNGAVLRNISLFDAAKFTAGSAAGTYKVTISGAVDGDYYTDYAIIHVQSHDQDHSWEGNDEGIGFVGESVYWVMPGDELTVTTVLGANFSLGGEYKTRIWSSQCSNGVFCTIDTSGENKETATIRVADDSVNGEIRLRVEVRNPWMFYSKEITIHVYKEFGFPYVLETTSVSKGSYVYDYRMNCRGPVHVVESSNELTDLSAGIMALLGTFDKTLEDADYRSSAGWSTIPADQIWNIRTKTGGPCIIGADFSFTVPKLIISENDLTLSSGSISSGSNSIIYIKGNHTLYVHWGSFYFDGIIYAPEGKVKIDVSEGFICGAVIAKEVEFVKDYGNGTFCIMDKQSVMEQVNELMAK